MMEKWAAAAATGFVLLSVGTAHATSFTRYSSAGETVRIASHATWDAQCQGAPAAVEIVEPPQHGRLTARIETITITRIETGSRRCMGARVEGRVVYYRPSPGFQGTDQFYYTSITKKGSPIPHRGEVTVR